MTGRLKATVLISGRGSNLQALIDAVAAGRLDLEIAQVISNVATAKGLQRAAQAGIPATVLEHGHFDDRADFDHALAARIGAGEPDLVILAGFMRILGEPVLQPFEGRMINLHPSLLPLYRGTDTYQQALEAGDRRYGASIHFVTGELDGGPVLAQVSTPIKAGDDRHSMAQRLAPLEHRLLLASVEFLTRHEVKCNGNRIFVDGEALAAPLQMRADDQLTT
ncbi:MAG: phosphoribosylglycinamide formyltransferase [Xanthomonadales bacterium]|nr:phosphoribosylglycinamide formyltransferase [Xanthomonadales bacterium]